MHLYGMIFYYHMVYVHTIAYQQAKVRPTCVWQQKYNNCFSYNIIIMT